MNIFILLAMIFAHILDDFVLQQSWLAKGKQRQWWIDNAPSRLYRYDFIMALAMHAMSWSFIILLPIAWNYGFNMRLGFFVAFVVNAIIHGTIDHLKANLGKINLLTDQSFHLAQIICTFVWLLGGGL